jgi:putative membrane protein
VTPSPWGTWNLSPPILLLVMGSAVVYARGIRTLWSNGRRGRGVSGWRAACFFGGLAALVGALVSPLDHAGAELLSAHMGQHLVLILAAAPLLVLGRPGVVVLAALPHARRRMIHRIVSRRPVQSAMWIVTAPLVAWFVHVGVVWAWHVPGAYQAALRHQPVHWLEHASFLGTAMLFWWVALEPGSHRRLAQGGDVLYLLAAWVQSGALGALFTFASVAIYPDYAVRTAALGVDPVRDQQVAGLIMWIPAGLVYLGVACALFVFWLQAVDAAGRRAEAREVVRA